MKKYGFFGGSFNPVTKAHIELAQEIVDKYGLDKVIFVPMGDNYNKKELISEQHRYNMLKIATCKYDKLEVSDIELNQNKNLSTLEAFCTIEEKYPDVEKYYIMGVDNVYKMLLSNDLKTLVENYKYIVIQRNLINCKELIKENEILMKNKEHFIIMENERHKGISSTNVREDFKKDNSVANVLDEKVIEYIKKNRLYRN